MANVGKGGGGGQEQMFLGEPQWEYLPGGRVRCMQTGHEMPVAAQATYGSTKKCRAALFEAALTKRNPPLNLFEQCPVAKDKIVCKLTGVILNKKEEAVWKHMLGKKFELKLAEKEAEKVMARADVEMVQNSCEYETSEKVAEIERPSGDAEEICRKNREKQSAICPDEDKTEDASSDGSDFWVPPQGDRWDFDNGNDRWSDSLPHDPSKGQASSKVNGENSAKVKGSKVENSDTEMVDGEEADQDSEASDEDGLTIRTKRMAPSGLRRHKKQGVKRSKNVASGHQSGV